MKKMIHASQSHTSASRREQEYLAGWQRERAELQNFRKRMHEQATRDQRQALRAVIEPLLGVADNFQAMIRHVPKELDGNAWVTGVVHIARQVEQLLAEYGITPIEAAGTVFDPSQHEAVEEVSDSDAPSGQVVEVLMPGYRLGEDVIRPARVKIAK